MRKTLYLDEESDNILNQMPAKKQSKFTREAIKQKFLSEKQKIEPEKPKIAKIEVKLH